ncbi:MAG: flagellar biosynthesis protein FlhB [Oscillospiraceae bacterium]|nr:flagellar biosynthesis protein FlhB [Oscillospiraceae bacterium]
MAQGAEEKTEKASAKKRRDARLEGQVLKSAEINTAFCSAVMFALLLLLWPGLTEKLAVICRDYLSAGTALGLGELSGGLVRTLLGRALGDMGGILLPILAAAMLSGLAVNLIQVGFLFTTKPLSPKLDRISPLKGFARIFSTRTLVELVKSVLKITVLGWIAYSDFRKMILAFPDYMGRDVGAAFLKIMSSAFTLALKMALVFAIIAAGDYLFQWRRYEKDLRMTKQEKKEEEKQEEGDPQIKSRIRQKMRQLSSRRMMLAVQTADFVLTNPTHYAVALKYDADGIGLPVVVAKGADYLARKIKECAAEYGVELIENRPLARSLYELCELGDVIPEEFYQVVADILRSVYIKKGIDIDDRIRRPPEQR